MEGGQTQSMDFLKKKEGDKQKQAIQQNKAFFSMFDCIKQQLLLIKSSNDPLNAFIGGGLHKGMITQIYGESGSAKTQLAMLFMLGALSRNMQCAYLATDKQISWSRFTTLAYNIMNEAQFQEKERLFMYKKCMDFTSGFRFVEQSLKIIKQTQGNRGGILVIDSIHGFINSCFETFNIDSDVFARSRKQAQVVNRLRWWAKMSGCAVLLINHAADVVDKRKNSTNRSVVAALGPSWELNLDQNIYVCKKGDVRELIVIHSPKCSAGKKGKFRIGEEGFIWISEEGVEY